jgi:hypothetical protein
VVLGSAVGEVKRAAHKLGRYHPDAEHLPLKEWSTIKELGILSVGQRGEKADTSEWKSGVIRAMKDHTAKIVSELEREQTTIRAQSPTVEEDPFDKLTRQQRQLVLYLDTCENKQASIHDAMKRAGKSYASKREWKSFLACVRRLDERLVDHYPHLEVEVDRIRKTLTLKERPQTATKATK